VYEKPSAASLAVTRRVSCAETTTTLIALPSTIVDIVIGSRGTPLDPAHVV